ALVAVDAPDRAYDAADTFFTGDPEARPGGPGVDLRDRLADPVSNGRTEHWEVALDAFSDEPLRGHGAAMYEALWAEDRDIELRVLDAHSLYLEVMSELGLVGLLLLLVALGGILVAFARGVRGPNRALYACLLGAGVVWCLRAAGDWDWEMPATGIWLFALGGVAAAAPWRERPAPAHRPRWPLAVALAWLAIAVGPLLVMLSQTNLNDAKFQLAQGDCVAASDHALTSIEMLSSRREPYELLGFCQALRGFPRQGVEAMRRAIEQDPKSWQARYGLAVVRAQAGEDPSGDLRDALAMNPMEEVVLDTIERFREAPRSQWPQVGAESQQAALDSGHLTVADQ
ncbi:MAG TPA: O-antigen ligase family protein, partial [Solirubrobacteraceae bacterium]|nr:O-antigen ligase family protein [Solirubrobacteraceae bacterium]